MRTDLPADPVVALPALSPPGLEAFSANPVIVRLVAAGRRLRSLDRERPWVLDTLVVVAVFAMFCLPDLVHDGAGRHEAKLRFTRLPVAGTLAFQLALVLPLWWRRRAPTGAFAVIAAVFTLQWALLVMVRADVALLIALYGLALHGRLRHLPWACAVMAGALGLVALRVSGVVTVGDALFFLLSAATASVALGLALRIRHAHMAALRERAVQLEVERDQRAALAAADERARVAREMHDIIGHNLSVIIGLADGGAYAAEADPGRGREALRLIAGTGREALGEIRRMLGVLRADREDGAVLRPQPGVADLDDLCERIRAAGPTVTYRTSGPLDTLDLGAQLTVYRIAQEALTNTLQHAGSTTSAQVRVTVDGPTVGIRVDDRGPVGPQLTDPQLTDPPRGAAPPPGGGHGLVGMRERAALYGGTVAAGPRPGGGWTVEARLILDPPADPGGSTP